MHAALRAGLHPSWASLAEEGWADMQTDLESSRDPFWIVTKTEWSGFFAGSLQQAISSKLQEMYLTVFVLRGILLPGWCYHFANLPHRSSIEDFPEGLFGLCDLRVEWISAQCLRSQHMCPDLAIPFLLSFLNSVSPFLSFLLVNESVTLPAALCEQAGQPAFGKRSKDIGLEFPLISYLSLDWSFCELSIVLPIRSVYVAFFNVL